MNMDNLKDTNLNKTTNENILLTHAISLIKKNNDEEIKKFFADMDSADFAQIIENLNA